MRAARTRPWGGRPAPRSCPGCARGREGCGSAGLGAAPPARRGRSTSPGTTRTRPGLGGRRRRRTRSLGPGCWPGLGAPSARPRPGLGLCGPHGPVYLPPEFLREEMGTALELVGPLPPDQRPGAHTEHGQAGCRKRTTGREGGRMPWPGSWLPPAPPSLWAENALRARKTSTPSHVLPLDWLPVCPIPASPLQGLP